MVTVNNALGYQGEMDDVITLPCSSSKTIAVGDMVGFNGTNAITPSDVTWDTNLATTQEAFHDIFVGICCVPHNGTLGNAVDHKVGVRPIGKAAFTCASGTFALGTFVGPAKQSGNALENQKVVAVASANLAIGRPGNHYGSNVTTLDVLFEGTKWNGGPKAMA